MRNSIEMSQSFFLSTPKGFPFPFSCSNPSSSGLSIPHLLASTRNQGIKPRINNVVLTGQGITNISKSDVAGKVILNIPVKFATGRLISTVRPEYRTAFALVRYIAARPFAKSVSSSIDSNSNESFFTKIMDRIKEFFYS